MKRRAWELFGLIAIQLALAGTIWLVERRRSLRPNDAVVLGGEAPRRESSRLPRLTLRRRDGSAAELRTSARPTLVHFWATWCPPCRAELPGLLGLPAKHPVDVLAVALDRDWSSVERFLDQGLSDVPGDLLPGGIVLGGIVPTDIVLGDAGEAQRALRIQQLPVTLLVQPGGLVSLRFEGARDWTDATFLQGWLDELRER
jgi:thiol-disulfide isomerase/thioredoxin